jgi:hypothetical protein
VIMRRAVAAFLALTAGCGKDPLAGLETGTAPAISDAQLFALAQPAGTWTYYKRSSALISHSSSPHPEPKIRVRFNATAAAQLDAAGKIIAGARFPDSSIVVKELYTDAGVLSRFAVMMKATGSASAGFGGWVWAEFRADGSAQYSTSGRGAACSACHSAGIDYTRMNDSHP